MLRLYGIIIIIYFIFILLSIIGIFKKNHLKIKYSPTGILLVIWLACIPILRIIILIGLMYLLLANVKLTIKKIEENDKDDMPL